MSLHAAAAKLEKDRVEAFAERMLGTLNGAAIALATSIGHRTGLFDAMADLPPSTSADIAAAAGLDERYVREWLGAMVTGGIVEYAPIRDTYRLPAEHAAVLSRRGPAHNLAVTAQIVPALAGVEDRLVRCFREGGGVPYEAFTRFHEVWTEESRQTVVSALFDSILPLDPQLPGRLRRGIDVMEAGCGHDRALLALASAYPNSRFTGYDLDEEAIAEARAAAREIGLGNLRFERRDLADLDARGAFDLVLAFDVIHAEARPDLVLAGLRRALRPGGRFLMQDVRVSSHLGENLEHPAGPFLYTLSYNHCMTVSLARGGMGLGACWGRERARSMLEEAGFADITVHDLPHDFLSYYCVARV